ncbi:MAG TPA: hypothetical protein VFL95_07840 [Gemmatimonadales bacterium]|nr:hypothetical protein [Gemmatimonadales bacterium]
MWFRKRKPDPAEAVRGLREQIFTMQAPDVGITPGPGHLRVWCVLMETGFAEGAASLLAVADGTVSLYFSNGGGIIGAGRHDEVRSAADRLIALADAHADDFAAASEHPLPAMGRVRFYIRTFDGCRTVEAGETELGENRRPLSPLFHAGQSVIAAVRMIQPRR